MGIENLMSMEHIGEYDVSMKSEILCKMIQNKGAYITSECKVDSELRSGEQSHTVL